MRLTSFLTAAAAIAVACSDPMSPKAGFDATFRLAGCTSAETPLPCHYYGSGGTQDYVDSGRIDFVRDRTVRWRLWHSVHQNPCYISGTNCSQDSKPFDDFAGSYHVRNDSIVLVIPALSGSDSSRVLAPEAVTRVPNFISANLNPLFDYSRAVFRP